MYKTTHTKGPSISTRIAAFESLVIGLVLATWAPKFLLLEPSATTPSLLGEALTIGLMGAVIIVAVTLFFQIPNTLQLRVIVLMALLTLLAIIGAAISFFTRISTLGVSANTVDPAKEAIDTAQVFYILSSIGIIAIIVLGIALFILSLRRFLQAKSLNL